MSRVPAVEIGHLHLDPDRSTLIPARIGRGTNLATGGEPLLLDPVAVTTTRLTTTDQMPGSICYAKDTGEVYEFAEHAARWQPVGARPCIALQGGWTKTFNDNSEATDDIQGTAQYLDQMTGNYTAVARAVSDVTLASAEHGLFLVALTLGVETATAMQLRVKLYDATATADMCTTNVEGNLATLFHVFVKSAGTAMKLQVKVLQDNTDNTNQDLETWSFVVLRLGSIDNAPVTTAYGGTLPTFVTGP